MPIVDVAIWQSPDYNDQTYAWKFPSNELSTWTQLIVNESQEAVLFRGGAMDGPFGPGRHVLKTENLPVLKNLLKLPFGRSPFTAEAWFVNKAIPLDVKWGTSEPIKLQDPLYNIMIPVVAYGQYGVQIEHSRKFLVKLVGAMPDFTRDKLREYFRGVIITVAKTVIAREIVRKKVSILEIAAQLTDLSAAIQDSLREALDEFGLKLVNFFVNSIDVQEGDQSIETLRAALAKRAEMAIVGYTYQQERSLNALEGAAGFTSADKGLQPAGNNIASSMVGLGVGLGAAVPLGAAIGGQMSSVIAPQFDGRPGTPPGSVPPQQQNIPTCPKCNGPRTPGSKFCTVCGASFESPDAAPCAKCGTMVPSGAKFCANCGTPTVVACTNCGAKLSPKNKFCPECGTPRAAGDKPAQPTGGA